MALSLRSFFGGGAAAAQTLDEADLDEPTTQVKMSAAPKGYDPLAGVSIMEQLRSGPTEARQPTRLPFIGHLPIVLALLMLFFNTRVSSLATASATTATEMQMLSQRLARGTALAVQGSVPAFEGVKDSRDRFRADLDALMKGGSVRGASVEAPSSEGAQAALNDVAAR